MKNRIVVIGAGISGAGAAVLAKKKGFEVFVSDKGIIIDENKTVLLNNEIEWEESNHTLEKILNANEVIKSPGIPDNVDLIQKLKCGVPSPWLQQLRLIHREAKHLRCRSHRFQ